MSGESIDVLGLLVKQRIQKLEDKISVLLSHIDGEECPLCGMNTVVRGDIDGCLSCDWALEDMQ